MKFTITRVLLYLCFVTAIYSCTNEKEFIENENNIKSRYISFDELKNNSLAFNEYKKTEEKTLQSKNSKLVYNDFYGFYIDIEKILYIEKEEYHSYTFIIKRDIETDKTENLIITLNSDNQYDSKIMQYDFTELDKEKILNNEIVVISKSNAEIINVSNLTGDPCYDLVYVPASTNSEGQITSSYVSVVEVPCGSSGGDGGSSGSSGGSSGSGGYSGPGGGDGSGYGGPNSTGYGDGNNNPPVPNDGGGSGGSTGGSSPNSPAIPIITAPVLNLDDEEFEIETPCIKIKKLFNIDTNQPNIKPIVQGLYPLITPQNTGEDGYIFNKSSSGIVTNQLATQSSNNTLSMTGGPDAYAVIHTHPLDTYPMFSWSDVFALYALNSSIATHNQGEAVLMLATKSDSMVNQLYAIVFNDEMSTTIQSIINSAENAGYTIDQIRINLDNIIKDEYDQQYATSPVPNYEKVFLQQMSQYNVSLYKANPGLTTFSRLAINPTSGNVAPTPCN